MGVFLSHSKYHNVVISIHCWHDANGLNDMLASTKLSHRVLIKQYNFPLSTLPQKCSSLQPCDLPQTKWDAAATTELRRSQSIPCAPWIDNAFLHIPLFFQKECIRGQILILLVIWRSYTSSILGWAFEWLREHIKGFLWRFELSAEFWALATYSPLCRRLDVKRQH